MRAKKQYRKLLKRVPEHDDVSHLNITPMMDMMTILLIFFLKDFSVSADNFTLSEDLTPPRSASKVEPKRAVQITVTRKAILVEAGDREEQVAAVKRGQVDSSVKKEGQSGYEITPLMAILQKHATRLKRIEQLTRGKQAFAGEVVVVADHATPFRLLSEILYTAGQAEFGRYRLMVLQGASPTAKN
ncbi:MAG: biopolymer transporter ExbD [Deltaproteobacteria bacterium]|nr:biopolymer transporter ExbD [Deltaproteobacteria bacterium]